MPHQSVPAEPLHIVVVDDDDLVRETIVDWLEAAGFVISAVACLTSGLALLHKAHRIDALVTDYNLGPSETGVQLALEARKLKPALPIIFITGNPVALEEDQKVPGAVVVEKAKGFATLAECIRTAIAPAR